MKRSKVSVLLRPVKRLLVCLFLSFLFLRGAVVLYASAENRFYFLWRRVDALGVILAITAVAGVLLLGYEVVSRQGRLGKAVAEVLFVVFALFYGKVALGESLDLSPALAVALKAGVVTLALLAAIRRKVLVGVTRSLCLICSPIVLLLALTLLAAKPVNSCEASSLSGGSMRETKVKDVYLFIFDQWAYQRVFSNAGDVLSRYPGTARVAARSASFSRAYSPGLYTSSSVSSMLCGAVGLGRVVKGDHCLETAGGLYPTSSLTNVFNVMMAGGYACIAYSPYLPLRDLFGDVFVREASYPFDRMFRSGVMGTCGHVLVDALRLRLGRYVPFIARQERRLRARHAARVHDQIHASVRREINEAGHKFVVAHYWLPHWPYVFSRTGLRSDCEDWAIRVADYQGNLDYLDTVIGDLWESLDAAGRLEDSIIIMTSDHNFQVDPLILDKGKEAFFHVPLFVHLPGQDAPEKVDAPFSTAWLMPLLEVYMNGNGNRIENTIIHLAQGRDIQFAEDDKEIDALREFAKVTTLSEE